MKPTSKSPILGSFEDIGKDVVREVVKTPGDIGGKILESLTGSTGTKAQQNQVKQPKTEEKTIIDKSIARAALQEFARPTKPKLTEYEQKQKEETQKKEMDQKQKETVGMQELQKMSSKKRRGDLYGIQGKASSEKSRNVRQD